MGAYHQRAADSADGDVAFRSLQRRVGAIARRYREVSADGADRDRARRLDSGDEPPALAVARALGGNGEIGADRSDREIAAGIDQRVRVIVRGGDAERAGNRVDGDVALFT